jgi:hypothetical protein
MVAGRAAPGLVVRLPPNLNFALAIFFVAETTPAAICFRDCGDSALVRYASNVRPDSVRCPRNSSRVTSYPPSDFTMSARLSNWCVSAVQLREIFASTADRRAEFPGLAASALYSAA